MEKENVRYRPDISGDTERRLHRETHSINANIEGHPIVDRRWELIKAVQEELGRDSEKEEDEDEEESDQEEPVALTAAERLHKATTQLP